MGIYVVLLVLVAIYWFYCLIGWLWK